MELVSGRLKMLILINKVFLLILPSSAGGEGRGEGYVIDFDVAMM
jgi:hypothetical protein